MSRAFSDIAFTPAVREMQTRMGSHSNYAAFDHDEDRHDRLGPMEVEFIAARDSFYQATVSETGWPYVQFRGGPSGFLKVLDEKTLGYADFRGNMQYISVGNFANNDRVSIILMDYANRRRLKLLGRVRVVSLDDDRALAAKLESPHYRARVQRGVIIDVEGYDWNCPQHITPRFTEAEIVEASAPLHAEIAALKAQLKAHVQPSAAGASVSPAPAPLPAVIGSGPLALGITGIRQLTPRVRVYELRAPDGVVLPVVAPGAHIDVPVRLPGNGATASIKATRRYSILSVSPYGHRYEIAVQRDDKGHGGSMAVHRDFQLGTVLNCGLPGNDFPLHEDDRPAVLIAGGIGITPIHAMAHALAARGSSVTLHYAARSRAQAALWEPLKRLLGDRLFSYFGDAAQRLDIDAVVGAAPRDAVFYVCGPASMIEAVRDAAQRHSIEPDRVCAEQFAAPPARTNDRPIQVTLRRSGKVIAVPAAQSILDAVQAVGIDAPASCRTGTCGTCAVKVIDGRADHRDTALTAAERDQAGLMCICVSRATTQALELDL